VEILNGISGRLVRFSEVWRRITSWIATRSGTEPAEDRVAFAVGVIALGAKMAKADGVVTMDEVNALRPRASRLAVESLATADAAKSKAASAASAASVQLARRLAPAS